MRKLMLLTKVITMLLIDKAHIRIKMQQTLKSHLLSDDHKSKQLTPTQIHCWTRSKT